MKVSRLHCTVTALLRMLYHSKELPFAAVHFGVVVLIFFISIKSLKFTEYILFTYYPFIDCHKA